MNKLITKMITKIITKIIPPRLSLKLILLVFIIVSLPLVQAAQVYYVELTKTDKGLSYSSLHLGNGNLPGPKEEGDYTAEIIDLENKVRYKTRFDYPLGQFTLVLPYFANGNQIIIKDKDNIALYNLPTGHFIDSCGDNICQNTENSLLCPWDCPITQRDNFCDYSADNACDPDCNSKDNHQDNNLDNNQDPDCTSLSASQPKEEPKISESETPSSTIPASPPKPLVEEKTISSWSLFLLILFLILLSLIFLFHHLYRKHRGQEIENYVAQNLQRGYSLEQIESALLNYGYQRKEIEPVIKGRDTIH
ncbi:hypothetical protein HYX12_02665 [Candidatus Woesearchaeota archaeon]|nr:hypothetical protein [Candidatus Woesearchaeota archaeon]